MPDDTAEPVGGNGSPPFVDGLTFNFSELPVESQPLMDLSIFDDVPLDEDGLPVLPPDFDRSLLPGFQDEEEFGQP